uniref:Uncharacterized protein n=1 Tax=Rhizophora mucronata TaxID=61149 RepID=A0A2P2PX43_RHIMU
MMVCIVRKSMFQKLWSYIICKIHAALDANVCWAIFRAV